MIEDPDSKHRLPANFALAGTGYGISLFRHDLRFRKNLAQIGTAQETGVPVDRQFLANRQLIAIKVIQGNTFTFQSQFEFPVNRVIPESSDLLPVAVTVEIAGNPANPLNTLHRSGSREEVNQCAMRRIKHGWNKSGLHKVANLLPAWRKFVHQQ